MKWKLFFKKNWLPILIFIILIVVWNVFLAITDEMLTNVDKFNEFLNKEWDYGLTYLEVLKIFHVSLMTCIMFTFVFGLCWCMYKIVEESAIKIFKKDKDKE